MMIWFFGFCYVYSLFFYKCKYKFFLLINFSWILGFRVLWLEMYFWKKEKWVLYNFFYLFMMCCLIFLFVLIWLMFVFLLNCYIEFIVVNGYWIGFLVIWMFFIKMLVWLRFVFISNVVFELFLYVRNIFRGFGIMVIWLMGVFGGILVGLFVLRKIDVLNGIFFWKLWVGRGRSCNFLFWWIWRILCWEFDYCDFW